MVVAVVQRNPWYGEVLSMCSVQNVEWRTNIRHSGEIEQRLP
jgi:hypothetical protein